MLRFDTIAQFSATPAATLAARVTDTALALIGPPLLYADMPDGSDLWMVALDIGPPNKPYLAGIHLGPAAVEPAELLEALADTVVVIQYTGALTKREAEEQAETLAADLRKHFKNVLPFATERAFMDAFVRHYPGKRSRRVYAAFDAEKAQA